MKPTIFEKYLPMTETAYYILLSLNVPIHGYGIILNVATLTEDRIRIGAGTIYGTLSKLEKDGLICAAFEEDRRKYYVQTDLGKELLRKEVDRLVELAEHGKLWRGQYEQANK